MNVLINITYQGQSGNYLVNMDPGVDDATIKGVCEEAVRSGEVSGISPAIPKNATRPFQKRSGGSRSSSFGTSGVLSNGAAGSGTAAHRAGRAPERHASGRCRGSACSCRSSPRAAHRREARRW